MMRVIDFITMMPRLLSMGWFLTSGDYEVEYLENNGFRATKVKESS